MRDRGGQRGSGLVGRGAERPHELDAFRRIERGIEAEAPGAAQRADARFGEAYRIRRQDDVKLGAAGEQGFGHDKLSPGGDRAEAEAHSGAIEECHDPFHRDVARAGEMDGARRPQHVEPAGAHAERLLDRDELAQGRGMILPGARRRDHRPRERGSRLVLIAENEPGLRLGCGAPIRSLRLLGRACDPIEHLPRDLPRPIDIARKQGQGRGIDQRVGGRLQRGRAAIGLGRLQIISPSLVTRRTQCPVLEQPSLDGQRRRIVVPRRVAGRGKLIPGMIKRPRASEGDDRGEGRGGSHLKSNYS